MIKLLTKKKSHYNYYLFDATDLDDLESISKDFEKNFGKQPLFYSSCTINAKSYAMIGTTDFLDTEDFKLPPIKIFQSPKNNPNQDNPQLESFYLCNFVKGDFIDSIFLPLLSDLIKWKFDINDSYSVKKLPSNENPIIFTFRCTPDEIRYRIKTLIPYFIENIFQDFFDNPVFTTKSDEIPVVMMKNNDSSSTHQLNLQNFTPIKNYIETENFGRIITFCELKQWIYMSFQSNKDAWNVINNLKYSLFQGELLQFTHFLDKKEMDVIAQWNLLILNINKKDDLKSIFNKYSNFENNNPEDSDSVKKILAMEIHEEEDSKNAKIQFLQKTDACDTFKNDTKNIKLFYFSMIIHHYDTGKEDELSKIFKNATYIIEKQNNSKRTRPIYHVFFDSKKDLSDALLYSGTIDKKSIAAEDEDETTNSKYVYKLSQGRDKGFYSNGLRAFCIAYRPIDEVNKIDNQLIRQTWTQNTVEIFDVDTDVDLSDAIEALTQSNEDCKLESIVFRKKSIIASFLNDYDFKQAMKAKEIEINGTEYLIKNFHRQ